MPRTTSGKRHTDTETKATVKDTDLATDKFLVGGWVEAKAKPRQRQS